MFFSVLLWVQLLPLICVGYATRSPTPQSRRSSSPARILEAAFSNASSVLLYPGSANYTSEISRIWNAASQEIQPQVIVKPVTTSQAATAIKLLSNNSIPFGILSGGHMPKYGAQTSTSVLISTSALNAQVIRPSNGTAIVGPGMKWGEVYEVLLETNTTAVGGRDYVVGVAGFLLGGGLSHLSAEYGIAADNILNAEVVLGSGEVVNANATSNTDLFWALKGGGNNFGLVTSFALATVEQPGGVWGGLLTISEEYLEDLLEELYTWQTEEQPKDLKGALELTILRGPGAGSVNASIISLSLFYNAPVENPDTFSGFLAIPSLASTLRITTHLDLAIELDRGSAQGLRHAFYTGTYKASAEVNVASTDAYFSSVINSDFFSDNTSFAAFTLQPISKSMLSKDEDGHAMTLSSEDAPYIWYNFAFQYNQSSLDTPVLEMSETIKNSIQDKAASLGKAVDFLFVNDAGSDQDPLASYGSTTDEKLKAVRSKYDPGLVFSKLCAGGFKLDS